MKKKILFLFIFFFSSSIFYYLGYKNFGTYLYTDFKCNFIEGEKTKNYCIFFSNGKSVENFNENEKELKLDLLKNYNPDIFKTSLKKKYFVGALGFENLSNERDLECTEAEGLYSNALLNLKILIKFTFIKRIIIKNFNISSWP